MKYSKKINNKDFMELYHLYNFYKTNEGEDSDVVYGIERTLKCLKIYDDILFYKFLQAQPYTIDKIYLEEIKEAIEKIYKNYHHDMLLSGEYVDVLKYDDTIEENTKNSLIEKIIYILQDNNIRLKELIEKEFLTREELNEIYSMKEIDKVEYNGNSEIHLGCCWYTIYLKNTGEEYDIYI